MINSTLLRFLKISNRNARHQIIFHCRRNSRSQEISSSYRWQSEEETEHFLRIFHTPFFLWFIDARCADVSSRRLIEKCQMILSTHKPNSFVPVVLRYWNSIVAFLLWDLLIMMEKTQTEPPPSIRLTNIRIWIEEHLDRPEPFLTFVNSLFDVHSNDRCRFFFSLRLGFFAGWQAWNDLDTVRKLSKIYQELKHITISKPNFLHPHRMLRQYFFSKRTPSIVLM